MSDFESIVSQIQMSTGMTRERAEEIALLNGHRALAPARAADMLEKREQHEVVKLYRAFGFKVYSLSQSRASKQTPGLPDLWCVHRDRPIAFWHETKRSVGGRASPAQQEFRDDCVRAGVGHVLGDRHAARSHLIRLGLARVAGDVLEPIRQVAG